MLGRFHNDDDSEKSKTEVLFVLKNAVICFGPNKINHFRMKPSPGICLNQNLIKIINVVQRYFIRSTKLLSERED